MMSDQRKSLSVRAGVFLGCIFLSFWSAPLGLLDSADNLSSVSYAVPVFQKHASVDPVPYPIRVDFVLSLEVPERSPVGDVIEIKSRIDVIEYPWSESRESVSRRLVTSNPEETRVLLSAAGFEFSEVDPEWVVLRNDPLPAERRWDVVPTDMGRRILNFTIRQDFANIPLIDDPFAKDDEAAVLPKAFLSINGQETSVQIGDDVRVPIEIVSRTGFSGFDQEAMFLVSAVGGIVTGAALLWSAIAAIGKWVAARSQNFKSKPGLSHGVENVATPAGAALPAEQPPPPLQSSLAGSNLPDMAKSESAAPVGEPRHSNAPGGAAAPPGESAPVPVQPKNIE